MTTEEIFGRKVVRIQCDDVEVYKNEDLVKSVNQVFNLKSVKTRYRGMKGDSHKGSGLTTVGQPYLDLVNLPGSKPLREWVTQQLLSVKDELGVQRECKGVNFKRSWANRLFRDGQGMCHNHIKVDTYMREMTNYTDDNFKPDAVAIFYVDVPEGSSNLVFIRDGKDDTYINDYDLSDIHPLIPKEGELVIHSPDVWHAVSVHQSDLPRNVYVFDIDYV